MLSLYFGLIDLDQTPLIDCPNEIGDFKRRSDTSKAAESV